MQVALAVALLTVTTLLTMSLARLLRSDCGFSPGQLVAVDVSLPAGRYGDQEKVTVAYDQILERRSVIPGISSASWVSALPLSGENWVDSVRGLDDTRPFTQIPTANYRFVGPDYFKTIGMPITRGRSFTNAERGGAAHFRVFPCSSYIYRQPLPDVGYCLVRPSTLQRDCAAFCRSACAVGVSDSLLRLARSGADAA